MFNLNFSSFLVNYFSSAKLACVVLFHCWNRETLYRFSILSSQYSLYSQYVNLNDNNALSNFGYRYLRYNQPQIGIFMDFTCNQTDYIIHRSSHQRLFNYRYNWLIYDDLSNFSRFYDIFNNVNLSVDTKMTYVKPNTLGLNNSVYTTFDVYNNGWFIGGSLNMTANYEIDCHKTKCQKRKYLSELSKRTTYGNRDSLRDITMRVAVVIGSHDLNVSEKELQRQLLSETDLHLYTIPRFDFHLFMVLKDYLYAKVSFSYYKVWSDTELKGGIVGALIEDTADFSSAAFFHTTNRFHYLVPITQISTSRAVCMFRTPSNSGIQSRVFIDPFSTKVWFLFAVILALCGLTLWIIFFVELHKLKNYCEFVPSLLTTCLISFGSACAQGSFLSPNSMGGRLAFISLFLFSFLMYNYYTSVVVSSLLGSPVKSNIKTVADLADSNLEVGLQPLPYMIAYLNFSKLPVVRQFVKRKIETKRDTKSVWQPLQTGLNKMRFNPGFVYIFEAQDGYNIIEKQYEPHEINDLNEFQFRYDTVLSLHLHRNSSYREIIRLRMLRILESGILAKHQHVWIRTRLNYMASSFLLSVGLEYTAPLFLLLLGSYLITLMVLLLEILWHRYTKRNANKRNQTGP